MTAMAYCVYEHVFPNGKKYIGITNDPEKRWRNGKGYETQGKIANAIKHYGWQNIQHNIIIDGVSKEQAETLEKYLIAELNTVEEGYNTAIGGDEITASYLNEHVLYMIRESKKQDEKYEEIQTPDSIVSWAEKAKFSKQLADMFNALDKYVEEHHADYKTYHSTRFFDGEHIRCDMYWFYMRESYLVLTGQKEKADDYFAVLFADKGIGE